MITRNDSPAGSSAGVDHAQIADRDKDKNNQGKTRKGTAVSVAEGQNRTVSTTSAQGAVGHMANIEVGAVGGHTPAPRADLREGLYAKVNKKKKEQPKQQPMGGATGGNDGVYEEVWNARTASPNRSRGLERRNAVRVTASGERKGGDQKQSPSKHRSPDSPQRREHIYASIDEIQSAESE